MRSSMLFAACLGLALATTADAGVYADLTADWNNNNQQLFPDHDANQFTKAELMASILGLYWGDFDGARTAQHRMRREDGADPNLYSQYVGWIPLRALIYEHKAIQVGLDAVIPRLRNPANYRCLGLERGGGFLVDVINQMPAPQNANGPFQCQRVAKDPNRPGGNEQRSLPTGNGNNAVKEQDRGKLSDQAQLRQAIAQANPNDDIVIVDSFVSGDSMMYTLETVADLLANGPNPQQRFIILAIRDGARTQGGYQQGQLEGYASDGSLAPPYSFMQQPDMGAWRKGNNSHFSGADVATWLMNTYQERFTMLIATGWYLVAEDVGMQLTQNAAPAGKKLYLYQFFDPNTNKSTRPYWPNVAVAEGVTLPSQPNPLPRFMVWSWTPAPNESLRSELARLVANARISNHQFVLKQNAINAPVLPNYP